MGRKILMIGAALPALTIAMPSVAQTSEQDPASASVSTPTSSSEPGADIVVTARKRGEERLQDIPASITAIGGEALQKQGVTQFADFAYRVPGLTFTDQGPGLKRYTLRGVQSAGQEQVAVYYDEVPVPGIQSSTGDSGSQIGDLQLYDLDRVEVLKGPQSTTFGANSQTGAVRFILKKPQLDTVAGSAQLNLNTVEHGQPGGNAFGMINLPIVDGVLGLRVVGGVEQTGGYVDNVRFNQKDINSDTTYGIRGMLRYQPTEAITIDAMAWYQKRMTDGASEYHPFDSFHVRGDTGDQGYKDTIPAFAFFETGEYNAGFYVQTPRPDKQQLYSLTGTFDLGFATLTATGSIYDRKYQYFRDNSFSIISIRGGPAGAICLNGVPCTRPDLFPELTDQTQSLNQKTAEVRLNSNGDGIFQYLVGVFYRDRGSDFRSYSPIVDDAGYPIVVGPPYSGFSTTPGSGIEDCNPCGFARVNTRSVREGAAFGEATLKPKDWIEINGGLRYFAADQRDFGSTLFQSPLLGSTLPADYNRRAKENRLIKKGQVSLKPTKDVSFYVLASEGFRLGGTNQSATVAVPDGYESDSLWNYEVGVKSAWFDRRLIANLAVYRIDWDNIQVTGRDPTGTFAFIGNAGTARFEGVEFELSARILPRFEINGGFNWLPKHELTENQVSSTIVATGLKGDKIPRIPTFTGTVSAQYTAPLGGGWNGYARGDYSYKGKSGTEFRPTSALYRVQADYSIVNARLGIDSPDGFGVQVYVDNVFDVAGDVFLTASTAAPTSKISNRPRTAGVTLSKRF